MYRIPSVETLTRIPGVTPELAQKLRQRMTGHSNAYIAWLRARDVLTDAGIGYGGESIPGGRGRNSPFVAYVNRGDPYDTTLLYTRRNGENGVLSVGSWGDIAERGNYA